MTVLFWLSFRDPLRDKWLGGCFVRCSPTNDALRQASKKGVNPGGEVIIEEWMEPLPKGLKVNHLYTNKAEFVRIFG